VKSLGIITNWKINFTSSLT